MISERIKINYLSLKQNHGAIKKKEYAEIIIRIIKGS